MYRMMTFRLKDNQDEDHRRDIDAAKIERRRIGRNNGSVLLTEFA
jgi:hypothetical protein